LALLVHDVVVLERVLALIEVAALDLLLGALDRARHHAALDRHVLLEAEPLHQARHAVEAEDAQQVVLERQVEARRAGVALAAGPAAQLVVDAARLVALGADDLEAAGLEDFLLLRAALLLELLEQDGEARVLVEGGADRAAVRAVAVALGGRTFALGPGD